MVRIVSDETRLKIKHTLTGKKHNLERIEKNRIGHLGKKIPLETRIKMSLAQKGRIQKPITEETRKKMSLSHMGHKINLGRKHSRETKIKISLSRKGKNKGTLNHAWKGGVTPQIVFARHSSDYVQWRISVFERDSYTCQICKKIGGRLEAHHIKPFSYFPELRYDINNGVTCCFDCHCLIDKNRKKKKEIANG